MADEIDLANDRMDREISDALNKIRQNAASKTPGTKVCLECGDNMHVERQKHGYKFCVQCASEIERRNSQYA